MHFSILRQGRRKTRKVHKGVQRIEALLAWTPHWRTWWHRTCHVALRTRPQHFWTCIPLSWHTKCLIVAAVQFLQTIFTLRLAYFASSRPKTEMRVSTLYTDIIPSTADVIWSISPFFFRKISFFGILAFNVVSTSLWRTILLPTLTLWDIHAVKKFLFFRFIFTIRLSVALSLSSLSSLSGLDFDDSARKKAFAQLLYSRSRCTITEFSDTCNETFRLSLL